MEPLPEQAESDIPAVRKPNKDSTWLGPKESAVRQHRQELKTKMKTNKVEEVKHARPKQVRQRQKQSEQRNVFSQAASVRFDQYETSLHRSERNTCFAQ